MSMGNPNIGQLNRDKKIKAKEYALSLKDLLVEKRKRCYGNKRLADYLNQQKIPSPNGKKWHPNSVKRICNLLKIERAQKVMSRNFLSGLFIYLKEIGGAEDNPEIYFLDIMLKYNSYDHFRSEYRGMGIVNYMIDSIYKKCDHIFEDFIDWCIVCSIIDQVVDEYHEKNSKGEK